jgi:hypothetical protein
MTERKLFIVTNCPVSMNCNFHLLADGLYGRREVERFIANLQMQLSAGAFGELTPGYPPAVPPPVGWPTEVYAPETGSEHGK